MDVDDANIAPPEQPTPTRQPQRRRGRRGKPAQQKRIDAFRREKNKVTMARATAEVMARLRGPGVDQVIDMIERLKISEQQHSVVLPATTRGAGFLSDTVYRDIVALDPKLADVDCDANVIYRITLAQQSVQLCVADRVASGPVQLPPGDVHYYDSMLPSDFCTRIATVTETLVPLYLAVKPLGNFDHEGVHYKSAVVRPVMPQALCAQLEMDAEGTFEDDGDDPPLRRRRRLPSYRRVFLPDPFTVTIRNLRATVRALADSATPVVVRQYFQRWNPLPNAIWDESALLLNPDVICPPRYMASSDLWRSDVLRFNGLMQHVTKRFGRLVTPVNLDGCGDRRLLVGYQPGTDLCRLSETGVEFPTQCLFTMSRHIDHVDFILGAIGLLGESPPDYAAYGYGLRERCTQVASQSLDWMALVDAMFTKV